MNAGILLVDSKKLSKKSDNKTENKLGNVLVFHTFSGALDKLRVVHGVTTKSTAF